MIICWADRQGAALGTAWYCAFAEDVLAEATAQWPVARNCKIGNLRVNVVGAPTGDIVTTVRIVVNGTDSDLVATLNPGQTTASCLNRYVTLTAGDRIALKNVSAGTAGTAYDWMRVTAELLDFGPIRRLDA